MLLAIILIILVFMLFGAYPRWGYSSGWGYGPFGIVGVLIIVLLVFLLLGYSP